MQLHKNAFERKKTTALSVLPPVFLNQSCGKLPSELKHIKKTWPSSRIRDETAASNQLLTVL